MSEFNVGLDVVSMKFCVEKRGDKYILNGNKMWIINGFDVYIFVIYVKIDVSVGVKGIMVFIVECDFVGFSCV